MQAEPSCFPGCRGVAAHVLMCWVHRRWHCLPRLRIGFPNCIALIAPPITTIYTHASHVFNPHNLHASSFVILRANRWGHSASLVMLISPITADLPNRV